MSGREQYDNASELPESLRGTLDALVRKGPMTAAALMRVHRDASVGHFRRLVKAGLVESRQVTGLHGFLYSATAKGERWSVPPGIPAAPRTIPFAGTYVPPPWATWRPGQEAARAIRSVGYRH